MNVLFVGDIVGPEAARWLAERLPELRREHGHTSSSPTPRTAPSPAPHQ